MPSVASLMTQLEIKKINRRNWLFVMLIAALLSFIFLGCASERHATVTVPGKITMDQGEHQQWPWSIGEFKPGFVVSIAADGSTSATMTGDYTKETVDALGLAAIGVGAAAVAGGVPVP